MVYGWIGGSIGNQLVFGEIMSNSLVYVPVILASLVAGFIIGSIGGVELERQRAIEAGVASYFLTNPHSDQTKFMYKTLTIKLDSTH